MDFCNNTSFISTFSLGAQQFFFTHFLSQHNAAVLNNPKQRLKHQL